MATAAKMSLGKRVRPVPKYISHVPFHIVYLVLRNSSGVDYKALYLSSEKGKENRCLLSTFSIKCETRKFHIIVVQRQKRKYVQKMMMHVQFSCFAYLNLLLFCHSCCRHHRHCLSSLMIHMMMHFVGYAFPSFFPSDFATAS